MRKVALLAVALLAVASAPAGSAPATGCRATARGYVCVYGPYEVGSGGLRIPGDTRVEAIAEPGYITSARVTVVDAAGARIPEHELHLHHSGWLDPQGAELFCGLDAEPMFGTGKEDLELRLPEGTGYHWAALAPADETDPYWRMYGELVRMHGDAEAPVYLKVSLGFEPEDAETLSVRSAWMNVADCDESSTFDVLRGSGRDGVYRQRRTFRMPVAGRFVFMGGHLHDGALRLVLHNLTRGATIFVSRARYERRLEPWYLTSTTSMSRLPGVAFSAGDRMRLTAVYDSTRRWEDAMGIMRAAFIPEP